VVILTEWDQFRALDLDRVAQLMTAKVIIDLRNIYRPDEMRRRGFAYTSLGRG
jgi:UDPglucose 6-dehydrogenase